MDELVSGTTSKEPVHCSQCGELVVVEPGGEPTVCATCGATVAPHATTTGGPAVVEEARFLPSWLLDPATLLGEPGEYLCFEDGGEIVVVPLTREWTRIGRGLAADVRFDDPTVSRRHALIVRNVDGVRVLDDRSLNGVFVNGQRVEWSPLTHGDEIRVGRHRLFYATLDPVAATTPPATASPATPAAPTAS
jgi:hypothetical protein